MREPCERRVEKVEGRLGVVTGTRLLQSSLAVRHIIYMHSFTWGVHAHLNHGTNAAPPTARHAAQRCRRVLGVDSRVVAVTERRNGVVAVGGVEVIARRNGVLSGERRVARAALARDGILREVVVADEAAEGRLISHPRRVAAEDLARGR